jgi:hypothetical protein
MINPRIKSGRILQIIFFRIKLAAQRNLSAILSRTAVLALVRFPMIPRANPKIKAISLLIGLGIDSSQAGGKAVPGFNAEIAMSSELRRGTVKKYDVQNPAKFDRQTRGIRMRTPLNDSPFRCKIPDQTKENIRNGRTQIIASFRNRLTEYNCDFRDMSI